MVNLVVFGSVGLDSVKTPFGEVKEALGGSAIHASYAASFFTDVGVLAAAGKDFPEEYMQILKQRNIDLTGLQILPGKNMRWHAYYEYDMSHAHTIKTELNVLEEFNPTVPEAYRDCRHIFLANNDPEIQMRMLGQMKNKTATLDTMNLWIEKKKEHLLEAINRIDILLLNEAEARQLFSTTNLITAGMKALNHGLQACVIKKGEHGVLLFTDGKIFSLPGYPLENVRDPTGAGDAFAGALCGYLAKTNVSEENLRKAVVYGSAIASFNVEDFSLNRLINLSFADVEKRYQEFQEIIKFW